MITQFKKLVWTEHSKIKMRQYGLSKQKLLGILSKPERKEQGIVPGTTAVMKTNKIFFKAKQTTLSGAWQKPRKAPGEIWLMFRDTNPSGPKGYPSGQGFRKIISAWRYPGISRPGEEISVPDDIRQELLKENDNE